MHHPWDCGGGGRCEGGGGGQGPEGEETCSLCPAQLSLWRWLPGALLQCGGSDS